jgi:hypothetical protein
MSGSDMAKDEEGIENEEDYFTDAEMDEMEMQQDRRSREFREKERKFHKKMNFFFIIGFVIPMAVFIIILLIITI